MATFTKFQDFADQLGKGKHDFSSHAFKLALSNTAPSAASNTILTDITQIAAGNGYTTGGFALSCAWAESGGTGKLTITDLVITATGGAMATFRYLVIYNDTQTSPVDPLVGYYDYGSALTLAAGESLTVDFDGTNGVLTIA
jgi:hypothetical protein